jgi:hypothetical protein
MRRFAPNAVGDRVYRDTIGARVYGDNAEQVFHCGDRIDFRAKFPAPIQKAE